jgi:hypothetical protein
VWPGKFVSWTKYDKKMTAGIYVERNNVETQESRTVKRFSAGQIFDRVPVTRCLCVISKGLPDWNLLNVMAFRASPF